MSVCTSVVQSDGVSAQLIIPEENKIILANGKEYEYDVLMLAPGIGADLESIQGLKEAIFDGDCPVYTSKDYGTSKVNLFVLINSRQMLLWVDILMEMQFFTYPSSPFQEKSRHRIC